MGWRSVVLFMILALAAGAVLLARPRAAMWTGAVILMLLCALAAQIWMPGASWLFGWGALIGAALLFAAARKGAQSHTVVYGSAVVGGIWGALLLAGDFKDDSFRPTPLVRDKSAWNMNDAAPLAAHLRMKA